MFYLLDTKLLQNRPAWQSFPVSLQHFLQICSGDCFYLSLAFLLLTYQPISSANLSKEPKCFCKHLNMHILEVEVQLGQCSPSGLTWKYLRSSPLCAGPAQQAEPVLPGSFVQGGTKLEFSPSSQWWRENGRTGSCLAATGNKKSAKEDKVKKY